MRALYQVSFPLLRWSAEFEVENIGQQPITYMELTTQTNYQQSLRDPPPSTFVWDKDKILSALPLLPGTKFSFGTSFTATPFTYVCNLAVLYPAMLSLLF